MIAARVSEVSAPLDPTIDLGTGSRVRLTRANSELTGAFGSVTGAVNGWFKVSGPAG